MNEAALRNDICEVGRRLYMRNLTAATDGNISVRLGEGRYLCTPSAISLGFMRPEDLIIADDDANKVAGEGRVTSEFRTHLEAHHERPDIEAVIHAHPPNVTALSLAGISMADAVLPEMVVLFGGVPATGYAMPGSPDGAGVIRELIRECDALMLDRHGALSIGLDVFDAYYKMEKVEHAASILVTAHLLGGSPELLTKEQVLRLQAGRAPYGATGLAFPRPRCRDA